MTSPSINKEDFDSAMRCSLKEHWRLFTVQGVLLVIVGMIAVAAPQLAAVFTSAFIGWFLFFSGIFRTFSLIRSTRAPGYWSSLLLANLTAIVGFIMAVTLTMLLTAYFIVHGIGSFILAFSVKGETGRWVLLLISGLIDFLLAGLVIAKWPSTALWVLGLFVGINMLLTGFAFIFAALGARSAEPGERRP
jgi:uncharacterized membrane protein HdeD (DUF308 family)